MKNETLGVAVTTRDEADRILDLMKSVSFAHQVIVVDSGSTDGTPTLCTISGAQVIRRPWDGYATQKQFALEAVQCDWVLNLDADERVPESLAAEITNAVAAAGMDVAGFSMPRLSFYLNRWIRHGGWFPDRKIRLVRRGKGKWSRDPLHEKLLVAGKILPLSQPLHHFVYRGISDQVATINRFSNVVVADKGPASGAYLLLGLLHSVVKFMESYFWKLGFLDGFAGIVIAANSSWYVFLKHAKAWELSLKQQEDGDAAGD